MTPTLEDIKVSWGNVISRLENRFNLEIDRTFSDMILEFSIIPSYTKDRHYHTLRHIFYMLKHARDFKLSFKDLTLLELAIWFHDIVYDSTRTDNEELSASQFEGFARAIDMEEEDIQIVRWLILITKHAGNPQTELEEIVCDLDLREFASDRQKQNAPEVRKEFSHASDKDWKTGRIEFIESMLAKEWIYHTDLYRETLEDTARHNLIEEKESINNE